MYDQVANARVQDGVAPSIEEVLTGTLNFVRGLSTEGRLMFFKEFRSAVVAIMDEDLKCMDSQRETLTYEIKECHEALKTIVAAQ